MEFILVIGLIVTMFFVFPKLSSKILVNGTSKKLVIEKKKCPPHQWFWQEIVDQDGNNQGQRIVCKICGPLSKSLNGGQE